MNHSDEAIDKVLSALRNVEAPTGMEFRILRELEHRGAIQAERRSRTGWLSLPARRSLAFGAAFAGLLVVALLVPAVLRPKHPHAAATESAEVPTTRPRSIPTAQVSSAPHLQPREGSKEARKTRVHQEDPLSLEAVHAQDQPPPPLPLTEQEKLLLRIAHRGDPQQMAMLNAQVRFQEEKEEKTDFQNFFEPPVSGENR